MMTLDRNAMMDRLREEVLWDVCIIGGGATGLGSPLRRPPVD